MVLFFYFYNEDAFHDEKEKTLASAGCMLEELKVSSIPEKMEIVHELEKGNSPRGIVRHNWDCIESFYVIGISLLWLEYHGINPENIGTVQEIIQESSPFDCPPYCDHKEYQPNIESSIFKCVSTALLLLMQVTCLLID